jgi:hypothetical protein
MFLRAGSPGNYQVTKRFWLSRNELEKASPQRAPSTQRGKIGSASGAFTLVTFVAFVVKNGFPVKNGRTKIPNI